MPTYILKCPKCDEKDERFCPVNERNAQVCSHCDTIMDVIIQPVAAHWKGDCSFSASAGKICKD